MAPDINTWIVILSKPTKVKRGDLITHADFGYGFVTAVRFSYVYVQWDGKDMPEPFLVRDLVWMEALKAYTFRKGFEIVQGKR